ncbi:unnamed protein product (macronuclear) [Paramecium tetraurelia]|uniref:Uncharacterized protein n=1 Tax=Paramecium tetraurelia TaxID=5888 RepID=A0CFC5_PARTE|nr:uncharacterized protein GSPATT00037931001 [Paramecium tetraurelia]CAK69492.1 unnamed protein product [Paramecium tetraurelia]|eukprot:XP_001436889.1 hypothetical protein (macronuclear) [Paramecium tetraurelia strain d4-2]
MFGKKKSSSVGFNPFSRFEQEKPSISTKIINKLKSLFQTNLNPSSCIKRELISQQTIYVPVDLDIVGAQTIEHGNINIDQDSIQICHSQSSIKQRRYKPTSFDDHLKEQQKQIKLLDDFNQKLQKKEEKHLKKVNALQQSFDRVLPQDIHITEDKKDIQPRKKLSSQQYKKRKLDLGIQFVYKKHVYDQYQDSIDESRIKVIPEQMSDDSLKNNSLLAAELKVQPKNKEIIIISLENQQKQELEPPLINGIKENQSKKLRKSSSMINLNEQEAKSFSCSPKELENSQSRKQSDLINITKQVEPLINEVRKEIKKNEKQTEFSVQPQQTVINFLVQGSGEQQKIQTTNNSTSQKKEVPEEVKQTEVQESHINNFSETPLFGFGKNSNGPQMIPYKINVQSSLFAFNDSKDQDVQKSSNNCSGQNLFQNQFTFSQNKSQPQNSIVNNNKESSDQKQKVEESKQTYSLFNNTQESQNDQFPLKKQLFQNLTYQSQSTQGEQKEESKQNQPDDSNQKPDIENTQPISIGLNLQLKSSSDNKKDIQFNINSQLNQVGQQTPFQILQQQPPKNENNKTDTYTPDLLINKVATPAKQISNPFLQQSPKIDQEQIIDYFSNHLQQQNNINQDDPAKAQISQFSNELFQQQNIGASMFNLQNRNAFQESLSNNMKMNNNGVKNDMEITDTLLPSQQFQQPLQTQNTFGSFNQSQLGTNNFFPQMQQQISGGFNPVQYFQKNPLQQNEHQPQYFQLHQTNGIFAQDPPKQTNQSQSLNNSFSSRNGNKKQRIDQ